jgi:hypothetical protein
MIRFGMLLLCGLQVAATSAAAEDLIQAGQWKVTATTVMNGAATPPQAKARCLTPEQVGDVAKTFGPVSGTVNSTCEKTEYEANGRTLNGTCNARVKSISTSQAVSTSIPHCTTLLRSLPKAGWPVR